MSQLSSFVWSVADLLRGPYKQDQYGDIILPLTILRRLECVMEHVVRVETDADGEEHEVTAREIVADVIAEYDDNLRRSRFVRLRTATDDYPGLTFWNSSPYTLAKALEEPDNLAANLVDYINGFSPEVDVFKHFELEKHIADLDRHERLGHVIARFARMDLHPDTVSNADMGDLFEDLIFRDFESSNAEAGDHYTPRDAIRLLVDLLFADDTDALRGRGVIRRIYDPTAGTGGMLSVAEERLKELNSHARVTLYAQEINDSSYAVCKSDMMTKGQSTDNVKLGNTLTDDKFEDSKFDYVLSNPPFGVDWKADADYVIDEHNRLGMRGRFGPGLPAVGDGAMLFLLHVVSKLRDIDEFGRGGRGGIVLNGSPLFNGGAGSGPSEIRGHLLENDLLEAIVALPNDMFYNTGIATYLWIMTTAKPEHRKGKVQLIDASTLGTKMRKSLGSKRVEVAEADRAKIVQEYDAATETDISKVFDNLDFAYWQVTIERPLRLDFTCTPERVKAVADHRTLGKITGLSAALSTFNETVSADLYLNREAFLKDLGKHLGSNDVPLTAAQRKALWQTLGQRNDEANICATKNRSTGLLEPEPDTSLRDTEIVPFGWGGRDKSHDATESTIAEYFDVEVRPHMPIVEDKRYVEFFNATMRPSSPGTTAPDAWVDTAKTKVGYEIPFTRHFYTYVPPRPMAEIDADLNKVVGEIMDMLREVER